MLKMTSAATSSATNANISRPTVSGRLADVASSASFRIASCPVLTLYRPPSAADTRCFSASWPVSPRAATFTSS